MRALALLFLPFLLPPSAASAAPSTASHLLNSAGGQIACLDIVNDGTNDQLQAAACGNYSGQLWHFAPAGVAGYFALRTEFTGPDQCLDVINDGTNDRVHMAQCANVTGQQWRVHRRPGARITLTNRFTGNEECLDNTPDGLRLRGCDAHAGQAWERLGAGRR